MHSRSWVLRLATLVVAACGDDGVTTQDAGIDASFAPIDIAVERVAAPLQVGYTLHGGDGHVWVRASTGLFRSTDAGGSWTKIVDDATGSVEIAADSTVFVSRVTGGFGNETVTMERHVAGVTTPLIVPASFPQTGRATGATAEVDGQTLYVNVVGRDDPSTVAAAQLFISPDRGDSFSTLAAPPTGADVTTWGMRACSGMLAVWPQGGTSTVSYVYRNAAWETLVTPPVLDVACAEAGTFAVSTRMASEARVHRVSWDSGGTRTETSIVLAEPLYALVPGPGGSLTGASLGGATVFTSTDGGASFASRAAAALQPVAAHQIVRTATGLWSLSLTFPTVLPDTEASWRLPGLPIGDGLSFAIDIGFLGERRIAAMYVHPLAGGAAGYFLFTSEDAGATWQYASNPAVAITCMSVSDAGVFLGGAGDDTGVKWAVHDAQGVAVLANDIVRANNSTDTTALTDPIIGCGWIPAGLNSTVYIAQTHRDLLPISRIRAHNPWGTFQNWNVLSYFPDSAFRITAMDLVGGGGITPIIYTAWERLRIGPGGYGAQAMRGSIDLGHGNMMFNEDDRNARQVGARAAIQLDGFTSLYAGNRVIVHVIQDTTITGLPANDEIASARVDASGTLWLSTLGGFFKSTGPITPPQN